MKTYFPLDKKKITYMVTFKLGIQLSTFKPNHHTFGVKKQKGA